MTKYLSWLLIDKFNYKHIMIFLNNINWYICKQLYVNIFSSSIANPKYTPLDRQMYPWGTYTPGWEPLG